LPTGMLLDMRSGVNGGMLDERHAQAKRT